MRVRSVTAGARVSYPLRGEEWRSAGRFLARSAEVFAEYGLEVQTTRVATEPWPELLGPGRTGRAVDFAKQVEDAARDLGVGYCSLGPVREALLGFEAAVRCRQVVPDIIASTETIFTSVETAADGVVFPAAVADAARIIRRIADITVEGFGNLRFAAISHCPPGIPFFPAGYHSGAGNGFSVALEAADVAVACFAEAGTLQEAESRLVETLEREGRRVQTAAEKLEAESGWRFTGMDVSLAPFPRRDRSIGGALEDLGLEAFGAAGTLFAAALTARALRRTSLKKCGFSGLMLPVLEDSVLAARAGQGLLTINDLLLYSAVCGTGLDTVPLPGDVSQEELAGILLDVAALSTALGKPLTARLLPVPGKSAGQTTEFHFPYFANSAVLPTRGLGARGLFSRGGHAPV